MKWTDFIGAALTAAAVGCLWLAVPEEGDATSGPRNAPQPVPGKPAADAPIDQAAGWKLWRSTQQGLQMRYPPEWTLTPAPSTSSDGKSLRLPGLFVAGVQSPQPRKSDPFGGSLQVDLQLHEDVTTDSEEITTWYLRNHRDPEEEKTGLAGLFRVPSGSIAVTVGPFEVPAGAAMRRSIRFDVPSGPDVFAIDKNEYFVKRGRDVLLISAFTPHGGGSSALLDAVDRVVSTLEVTGLPEQGRPGPSRHPVN